ncbi:MAG TPA: hypothetical protein VN737_05045 [Bryobacteraceae bacterium]|jgi:hypothetical protein|nr:hypothetical protein [Bryobacteraceae bacterium]
MMVFDDPDNEEEGTRDEGAKIDAPKPGVSLRTAMVLYAALGVLCLATLHGDPLYIALLIIGAIALKTWLAQVKSKIE